jgi:hypothetical protein
LIKEWVSPVFVANFRAKKEGSVGAIRTNI